MVTANDRLGHAPDERALVQLAMVVAAAKRAALMAQQIASAVGVTEGTIDELLERAGTRPEKGGRPTLGLSWPHARVPVSWPIPP
jgi:hypothetical protein